jgi:hypothetical protein
MRNYCGCYLVRSYYEMTFNFYLPSHFHEYDLIFVHGRLLGCSAVYPCRRVATFRRNMLPPPAGLTTEAVCFFETLVCACKSTRCHNLESNSNIFTAVRTL